MSALFRRRPRVVEGDLLEVRERYVAHDCKVPGPLDSRDEYRGSLADGSRWKCRRCGSVWLLINYYRFSHKWFRREDPRQDEFERTHDAEGRRLTGGSTPNPTEATRSNAPASYPDPLKRAKDDKSAS